MIHHHHPAEERDSGVSTGLILGLLVALLVAVVALFFIWGGPGRLLAPSQTNIIVPQQPPALQSPIGPSIQIPSGIGATPERQQPTSQATEQPTTVRSNPAPAGATARSTPAP